jgi:hypothetical protein
MKPLAAHAAFSQLMLHNVEVITIGVLSRLGL